MLLSPKNVPKALLGLLCTCLWEHAACPHCHPDFTCRVLASDWFINQHKAGHKVGVSPGVPEPCLWDSCKGLMCRSAYSSQGLQVRRRQLQFWPTVGSGSHLLHRHRQEGTDWCCLGPSKFPHVCHMLSGMSPGFPSGELSLHLSRLSVKAMVSYGLLCSGFSLKLILALFQK